MGTPVLGARIGGIPELIEEGVTGMTFGVENSVSYPFARYSLDFEMTASIQEVMETLCLLDDNLSWEKKNTG